MFNRFYRSSFIFYAPDNDAGGGGGGALPELPEALRGHYLPKSDVEANYVPRAAVEKDYIPLSKHTDTLNGTAGGYKKTISDLESRLASVSGERQSYFDQHAAAVAKLTERETKLKELEPLAAEAAKYKGEAEAAAAKNARLALLMGYPQLLNAGTIELVTNSMLSADALKAQLDTMAAAFKGAQPQPPTSTPPAPAPSGKPKWQTLQDEAIALQRKGDIDGFTAKMQEVWAAKDAEVGKFVPKEQSLP